MLSPFFNEVVGRESKLATLLKKASTKTEERSNVNSVFLKIVD